VRLIRDVPDESARDTAREHFREIAQRARIDVEPMIIVTENLREALLNVSRNAGIVFLGFEPPEPGEHIPFFQDIEVMTDSLHDVVLVCSAEALDLDA
jgi:hypothetical protein